MSINTMIGHLEQNLAATAIIDRQPSIAADMQDTAANIAKAARLLDWMPTTPPAQGLTATAQWHRQNSAWLDCVSL